MNTREDDVWEYETKPCSGAYNYETTVFRNGHRVGSAHWHDLGWRASSVAKRARRRYYKNQRKRERIRRRSGQLIKF